MELREFKNGRFQVWNDDGTKVLRPTTLDWCADFQAQHEFMYFNNRNGELRCVRRERI
jgi:hypothetical protein